MECCSVAILWKSSGLMTPPQKTKKRMGTWAPDMEGGFARLVLADWDS